MTTLLSHRRGSVCAAVLRTTDVDRAVAFYEAVLDVTAEQVPGSAGRVRVFRSGGHTVGYVQESSHVNAWIPFVSVDDLESAVARGISLGATGADRADVPALARLCTLTDPEGARIGLWQPDPVEGVERVDEPGSLWWTEVLSDHPVGAKAFYAGLCGWQVRETSFAPFPAYTVFERNGTSEAGVLPIGPDWDVSPRWNVIYHVADCDDLMRRACAHGGAEGFVHTVPQHGRIGSIVDPNGALFWLRSPAPLSV